MLTEKKGYKTTQKERTESKTTRSDQCAYDLLPTPWADGLPQFELLEWQHANSSNTNSHLICVKKNLLFHLVLGAGPKSAFSIGEDTNGRM